MKQLTKEQLENLYGYNGSSENQVLRNGEVGYCKEAKILVVCCRNCGDYSRVKIDKRKLQNEPAERVFVSCRITRSAVQIGIIMFAETYIKAGKLVKTKKHFFMCSKCGLVMVSPPTESYKYGLCWICFLKSKGFYKSAMKEIKIGWFTWSTGLLKEKLGWSFAENVYWCKLFMAVLRCGSLNKTPKIPLNKKLQDCGFSDWQVQIAKLNYNNEVTK